MDVVPIIKNLGGLPLLTLGPLLPTVALTREKFLSCPRGGCPDVSYVKGLTRLGKGSLLLARTMLLLLGCIVCTLGCPKKPKSPNFGMSLTPVVFIG